MYGTGIDLVKISRVTRVHERYGIRFARKVLNPKEIQEYEKRVGRSAEQYLAGRWCAKEAAYKAFGAWRIPFPDIVITNDGRGKPAISFEGRAAELTKELNIGKAHVSITHEGDYALANVLLEKTSLL